MFAIVSAMLQHVFTYGSLMFAPVWQAVVRGQYQAAPAVVDGYIRKSVIGETYPGIVVAEGAQVGGIVYMNVDAQDVAALDAFEGPDYRRIIVNAQLASGRCIEVSTYLYLPKTQLSETPWQPEEFDLQAFMLRHCRAAG